MLLKEVLFQSFKLAWHLSKFVFTIAIGDSQTYTDFQTSSTVLWWPSFCNQTCSNHQGLWCRIGIPKGWITIDFWPEHPHSKWETFDAGNKATQSPFATALSSLSHTVSPPITFLCQVNLLPTKPRSQNTHSLITSLNSCIWAIGRGLPPTFLWDLRISLKSPAHKQGKLNWELKLWRRFHEI